MNGEAESTLLYSVREAADGAMLVETTDAGMLRRLQQVAQRGELEVESRPIATSAKFVAEATPEGLYRITLTEEGIRTFETALGLADDFGRHSAISSRSTIADLMDRSATREELSEVKRAGRQNLVIRLRIAVLTARYRGSEEPSGEAKTVGHVCKAAVVGAVLLWTLQQFGIAVSDVQDIPGILAHIPSDILHLDPGHAIGQVGSKVEDATSHVVMGVEGTVATYIVAKIVRPLERIYRKDQLVTGARPVLRLANWLLRRATLVRR